MEKKELSFIELLAIHKTETDPVKLSKMQNFNDNYFNNSELVKNAKNEQEYLIAVQTLFKNYRTALNKFVSEL